jgi:hypothetical protein
LAHGWPVRSTVSVDGRSALSIRADVVAEHLFLLHVVVVIFVTAPPQARQCPGA